jgi:hypothetical protein
MAITITIPDDTKALLDHLADEGDHLAITLRAIIAALALDPSIPSYSASAADVSDAASAPGSAVTVSRGDHSHTHGSRAGGSTHPAATGSVAGFMAAADKTKLDGVASSATNTPLTSSAPVAVTSAAAEVGDGTSAARHNHKHQIAQASAGAEGLMSAAHYSKLDALGAEITVTPGTYTSVVVDAHGRVTSGT